MSPAWFACRRVRSFRRPAPTIFHQQRSPDAGRRAAAVGLRWWGRIECGGFRSIVYRPFTGARCDISGTRRDAPGAYAYAYAYAYARAYACACAYTNPCATPAAIGSTAACAIYRPSARDTPAAIHRSDWHFAALDARGRPGSVAVANEWPPREQIQ